jgi:hypothetical protein
MSAFKEEVIQFEKLEAKGQNGGFHTDRLMDAAALEELRQVMAELRPLKYGQTVNGNVRLDTYFVAWERDGGYYNGLELTVRTENVPSRGLKVVSLSSQPTQYTERKFENRFYKD